jgi:hypothetical protein
VFKQVQAEPEDQQDKMADIHLLINPDTWDMDWEDPANLADVEETSLEDDVIDMLNYAFSTDRVVDPNHRGVVGFDRRGCWQDNYIGESGNLFWLALMGYVSGDTVLAFIEGYAAQAADYIYQTGYIKQPAEIHASWISSEAIQLLVTVILNNGTVRVVPYVL